MRFSAWVLPFLSLPPGFPRKISLETARKLLYDLGFERTDSGKKGVYIDGHERPDVVQERFFLQKLNDLETHHLPPPCPSHISPLDSLPPPVGNFVSSKRLVIICHDESTFQSNEDQLYSWLQEDQHVIKPKSRGSGRMVSDFIDEFTGYLRLSDSEYEKAKISYPDHH